MFEFNDSVGDIRNSDLGEGIICSWEGSGGKGGGKWGKGGREVGEKGEGSGGKGEGSGECLPPCPPPQYKLLLDIPLRFKIDNAGIFFAPNSERSSHLKERILEQILSF